MEAHWLEVCGRQFLDTSRDLGKLHSRACVGLGFRIWQTLYVGHIAHPFEQTATIEHQRGDRGMQCKIQMRVSPKWDPRRIWENWHGRKLVMGFLLRDCIGTILRKSQMPLLEHNNFG